MIDAQPESKMLVVRLPQTAASSNRYNHSKPTEIPTNDPEIGGKSQNFLISPLPEMHQWGELVGAIKFSRPETSIQLLRQTYSQEKYWMDKF